LNTVRSSHTASYCPTGRCWCAGGFPSDETPLSSVEIYHPSVAIPAPVLNSSSGGASQGAILHAGTSDVATAGHPAIPGEILELYGFGLWAESVIPPQVSTGGGVAEALWFANVAGYAGWNQISVRVPAGIAPGPAAPVWLKYLDRPSNAVTIGVGKP
jgi:uncharacterized protein (TIGR03437 family)